MTGRGGGGGRKILLPPINFIFKLLQTHATVKIWLYEQLSIRIEGKIRVSHRLFCFFLNLFAPTNIYLPRDSTNS